SPIRRTALTGLRSSSSTPAMGCQCRRSTSPIGVPGPTWVSCRFFSSLSISAALHQTSPVAQGTTLPGMPPARPGRPAGTVPAGTTRGVAGVLSLRLEAGRLDDGSPVRQFGALHRLQFTAVAEVRVYPQALAHLLLDVGHLQ